MKAIHRLLSIYTTIIILFVALFVYVLVVEQPGPMDAFNMILSIVMFSLIPFGIILLVWKHHKH
jgi:membrane protease YdiL (CAAX protease family)